MGFGSLGGGIIGIKRVSLGKGWQGKTIDKMQKETHIHLHIDKLMDHVQIHVNDGVEEKVAQEMTDKIMTDFKRVIEAANRIDVSPKTDKEIIEQLLKEKNALLKELESCKSDLELAKAIGHLNLARRVK